MGKESSTRQLRSKCFRGKNLKNANFNRADIRGFNFSNANLENACFKQAKAGITTFWIVLLTLFLLLFTALSSLITAYTAALVVVPEDNSLIKLFLQTGLSLGVTLMILFVILRQGTGAALSCLGFLIASFIPIIAALAQYEPGTATEYIVGQVAVRSIGLAGMIAGIVMGGTVVASGLNLYNRWLLLGAGVAIPVALAAIREGIGDRVNYLDWPLSISINILVFSLIIHIGMRAVSGDVRYQSIQTIAIRIATFKGTCFKGSNLMDADFTQAQLKATDFRSTNLTRTCWLGAKWLEHACTWSTYLSDPVLRNLVVTGKGQSQNFDNRNLQGLFLQGALLCDTSFMSADLSNSDLQDADLSRAIMVRTQLYNTKLNRACLTGANIQDWAIALDTQFEGVACDYVYMHLPTPDDQDPYRKPDNRDEVFKPGDFTDFIAPIIKTLDLYKQQNVDPKASCNHLQNC